MDVDEVYVSITGLLLKRPWHAPRLLWHATRSMTQARRSAGNLRAEARTVAGVHHTLTVWRSAADMRAFLVVGAHGKAMKAFPLAMAM